jgi:hypothetical protein
MKDLVKIVVTVPEADAAKLRQAMGDAGAGKLGNYSHASFSVKGTGRFLPLEGAQPAVGKVGEPEEVAEERIEVTCEKSKLDALVQAIRGSHPYEEPVIDIYPLTDM